MARRAHVDVGSIAHSVGRDLAAPACPAGARASPGSGPARSGRPVRAVEPDAGRILRERTHG